MGVGHGRLLLASSWSYFSIYQKPCHVLLLTQMMHFEFESTIASPVKRGLSPITLLEKTIEGLLSIVASLR